jgi:O-antigen/teichoic acid export membrane protein
MLGVKNYGNRAIAQTKTPEERSITFWNIYALQLCTSIVITLLYCVYFETFAKNRLISQIQLLYVLTAVFDITWFFFGIEEFKTVMTRNIIIKLINVVCIFMFVRSKSDLWKYTLIMSLGLLLGNISILPFLRKYVSFVKPTFTEIKKHIKPNLALFVPALAVSLFNLMDKVMLGWLSTMTQTGFYENTERLMRVPFGVITALGNVMLPRMSSLVSHGKKNESEKMIEYSMIFTMFLAGGMTFGLAGVGTVFAGIFFGNDFLECGTLLMYIAPTILFISWANVVRMQYLIPYGMDREYTISTFVGAIVNLIINLSLIPKFGALGAVIGTVCAEAGVAIYQTYAVRHKLDIKKYFLETLPFVFWGIIMFIIIYGMAVIMKHNTITLFAQILAGLAIYLLLSFIYIKNSKKSALNEIYQMIKTMVSKKIHRI